MYYTFLANTNILNSTQSLQSGFWPHHSPETVLIKVLNNIYLNNDAKKISVLILLCFNKKIDGVGPVIMSIINGSIMLSNRYSEKI